MGININIHQYLSWMLILISSNIKSGNEAKRGGKYKETGQLVGEERKIDCSTMLTWK